MLHLIRSPWVERVVPNALATPRAEIPLAVDRLRLAKRLWRGVAADGEEFGFELETPLQDGDAIWESDIGRYVIRQQPEPVIAIPLNLDPMAAAKIGWNIGNLHLELAIEPGRLLAPDDPAVRQLLDRLEVPFHPASAVFRPARMPPHSHAHDHGHDHAH